MKKTIALAMMVALAGTAAAQQPADKKPAPAPAKKEPAPPATPAKQDAPKPAEAKKPPAEVADMAKMMAGNWKCTGKGLDPATGQMVDSKGTFKAVMDLDKWWIKGEWTGTSANTKAKNRGFNYMTYDAAGKKWYRMSMDNMGMGGHESSTGLPAGAKEGKVVWEGEMFMGGMLMKTRTTEEVAAKSVKMVGEASPDGKKWMTGWEMTCTK